MSRLSFHRFLVKSEHRDDPVGDIARDALSDLRSECLTSKSAGNIRRHIEEEHSYHDTAALVAFDRAVNERKANR